MRHRYIAAVAFFVLLLALSLFFFSGFHGGSHDSVLLPETTTCTKHAGIRYQNDSSIYHQLDAYLPDGEGPFPALIYVHGGGWVQGNRSDFSATAELYAKRGIAGFSIDYSLSTANATAWPQDLNDVVTAISFIQENAELFNVDPQRIGLMGTSAGAHLISLVGTLSGDESFVSTPLVQVKNSICLIISYDGVTDLEYVGKNLNPSLIYNIITGAFKESYTQNPNLWLEASPATYVSSGDLPFVFVHGQNDWVVPIGVAESFYAKLQNEGVETHFIKVDGDHDVLTNQEANLQARYQLDPLLAKVFSLKTDA